MDIYRAKHGDPSRHVPRRTSNDSNDSNDTNSKEIGPSFAFDVLCFLLLEILSLKKVLKNGFGYVCITEVFL